jgi:hypothetical protein
MTGSSARQAIMNKRHENQTFNTLMVRVPVMEVSVNEAKRRDTKPLASTFFVNVSVSEAEAWLEALAELSILARKWRDRSRGIDEKCGAW